MENNVNVVRLGEYGEVCTVFRQITRQDSGGGEWDVWGVLLQRDTGVPVITGGMNGSRLLLVEYAQVPERSTRATAGEPVPPTTWEVLHNEVDELQTVAGCADAFDWFERQQEFHDPPVGYGNAALNRRMWETYRTRVRAVMEFFDIGDATELGWLRDLLEQ